MTPKTENHGNGIRRDHTQSCKGSHCKCPYSFWYPSVNGKRERARIYGTLHDAKRAKFKAQLEADKKRRRLANQQAGIVPLMTIAKWYEHLKATVWSADRPATVYRRRYDFETFILPTLGKLRIDKITIQVVESWLYEQIAWKGNRRCVLGAYETLREALAIAERQRLIVDNPVRQVKYPLRNIEKREHTALSLDEYNRLLDACRQSTDRTIIRVLCEAGLRRAEIVGLQVGDIDLDAGLIHVRRRVWHGKREGTSVDLPKNGRMRVVGINPSLVAELMDHIAGLTDQRNEAPVWYTVWRKTPEPITGSMVSNMLIRVSALAGFEKVAGSNAVTPHMLRRTGATIAVTIGKVNPYLVMKQLGHSSLKTTERHYLSMPDASALKAYGEVFA